MRACSLLIIGLLAACGGASSRADPPIPSSTRACEDVYEDLTRYFDGAVERRRPPSLHADVFIPTCRELPVPAQRCLLFSYMQSHASQCDEILGHVSPDLMRRIASMVGK